jgi:hypothetical protein
MADRLFLYIDILGFKELIHSGDAKVGALYRIIDELQVHKRQEFTTIVFSDTILVYGHDGWLAHVNEGVMWLIEFAQDLFYRLIVKDLHFRAYVTIGAFEHYKLTNLEAYYGEALVQCYEREKQINCMGVFLDARLASYCNIFKLTKFDEASYFVHVLQRLDQVSFDYKDYPSPGRALTDTSMEWWSAYHFHYLKNIHVHANDPALPPKVRDKYTAAWRMIGTLHPGLLRRLEEVKFDLAQVIAIDWTEPLRRIGTDEGAWG